MIGIAQPDLSAALATVAHGAGRNWPGMYVHIHQGWKTARLTATNLDCYVSTTIPSYGDDGTAVFPIKEFTAFVKTLTGDINIDGPTVNKRPFICPESEFPEPRRGADILTTTVLAAREFKDVLTKVLTCAAGENSRPVLAGVFFDFSHDGLTLVSADGFRLARIPLTGNMTEHVKSADIILPAATLAKLVKILPKTGDVIFRSFANGIAEVSWDSTLFTTRVVEGRFPNYQQIIPPAFETLTTFDRKALIAELLPVACTAKNYAHISRWNLSEVGGATISTGPVNVSEYSVNIFAAIDGPDATIGSNVRFVLDFLRAATNERVTLQVNDGTSPAKWTSGTFEMVLMPMPIAR